MCKASKLAILWKEKWGKDMLDYLHCELCPRRCGVNRAAGQRGFCRMGSDLVAAKAMLHYWEEPVIAADFGAGAVFFSGCTLGCAYCQNSEISQQDFGKALTPQQLRAVFERLIDEGAENIDLVTPTHFLPAILPALTPKLPVPVVYNCGGYERVETLRALEGLVDIYLPDMKYSDAALAGKLSGAPDYPEVAAAAIEEMYRQVGPAEIEDGIMKRGLIVRHLVLPGYLDNSLGVIDWFSERFAGKNVLFSLMSQYVPMGRARQMPPLNRTLSEDEYAAVLSYLDLCGIKNGYTQDYSSASTNYIPKFNLEGL